MDFWTKDVSTDTPVFLVGTKDIALGSIGITKSGDLKCFFKDVSRERWAELEGFTEDQILTELSEEIVTEVTLEQFASCLIGGKLSIND